MGWATFSTRSPRPGTGTGDAFCGVGFFVPADRSALMRCLIRSQFFESCGRVIGGFVWKFLFIMVQFLSQQSPHSGFFLRNIPTLLRVAVVFPG